VESGGFCVDDTGMSQAKVQATGGRIGSELGGNPDLGRGERREAARMTSKASGEHWLGDLVEVWVCWCCNDMQVVKEEGSLWCAGSLGPVTAGGFARRAHGGCLGIWSR
jgi:hypothetical protein